MSKTDIRNEGILSLANRFATEERLQCSFFDDPEYYEFEGVKQMADMFFIYTDEQLRFLNLSFDCPAIPINDLVDIDQLERNQEDFPF